MVRCGETKMQRDEGIPGYLHSLLLWVQLFFPPACSADPLQSRLTWRQQLLIVIPSFPSLSLRRLPIFSFNLPTCFRASGDSLGGGPSVSSSSTIVPLTPTINPSFRDTLALLSWGNLHYSAHIPFYLQNYFFWFLQHFCFILLGIIHIFPIDYRLQRKVSRWFYSLC